MPNPVNHLTTYLEPVLAGAVPAGFVCVFLLMAAVVECLVVLSTITGLGLADLAALVVAGFVVIGFTGCFFSVCAPAAVPISKKAATGIMYFFMIVFFNEKNDTAKV